MPLAPGRTLSQYRITAAIGAGPTALFADVYDFGQGLSIPNCDVTRAGRFLMLQRVAQGDTLRVVLNCTEELKRTLAAGGVR